MALPLQSIRPVTRSAFIKLHGNVASSTAITIRTAQTASSQCQSKRIQRHYHSESHPTPPSYPPTETAILSAALSHVPEHGFSHRSLQMGSMDAGFLAVTPDNLLPRGVFELVMFHLVRERERLKSVVEGSSLDGRIGKAESERQQRLRDVWEKEKVGVGGRVRGLVLERLKANVDAGVVGRWQEALAIMAQPTYIPASTRELWSLADEIWFLAGDTSLDTSWYTKRASLSAIYAAAEVFQTQDQSTNYRDTEKFLDDRLKDLRTVGGALGNVGEWLGYTGHSVVNVLRSRGVRI